MEVFKGQASSSRSGEKFVRFNKMSGCYISGDAAAMMGWTDGTKLEISVDRETGEVWFAATEQEHQGVRRVTKTSSRGHVFSFSRNAQDWLGVKHGDRYPAYREDGKLRFSLSEGRPRVKK